MDSTYCMTIRTDYGDELEIFTVSKISEERARPRGSKSAIVTCLFSRPFSSKSETARKIVTPAVYLQNASPTERTRPARYQSATGRRRQRDLATRISLRRTQPKSSRPSALPGAAPAKLLRSLYAAHDGQKSLYGYWTWTWCNGRVWSVSGT